MNDNENIVKESGFTTSSRIEDLDRGNGLVSLKIDADNNNEIGLEKEAPLGLIKLRVNQEKFCNEYIKDGNATRSYLKAYNLPDSSEDTAAVNGCRLLTNAKIQARINQLESYRASAAKVTPEYIVSICRKIVEGYAEDKKSYKEGYAVSLATLKDFAGISTKSEVKTNDKDLTDTRHKIRKLLQQAVDIKAIRRPRTQPSVSQVKAA